jgi:hypothetical protein
VVLGVTLTFIHHKKDYELPRHGFLLQKIERAKVEFKEIARGTYYHKHLGVLGCAEMVNHLGPQLAVISEWGEEYSGDRATICNAIERECRTTHDQQKLRCIPGDRGMEIVAHFGPLPGQPDGVELRFRCSYRKTNQDLCESVVGFHELKIDRRFVAGDESIRFLCNKHGDL